MTSLNAPLAVYYEHPDWYRPLFDELSRRGVPHTRLLALSHTFDPAERPGFAVLLNRMSPSAYTRGAGDLTFYTSHYLSHLERHGVRVVNGAEAWAIEISKAKQLTLLERLGLPAPKSRVIHRWDQAPAASEGLRFPIVVKANVGGSGAGIVRFSTRAELDSVALEARVPLSIDGTALVQEFVPARDGRIVRVEVLNGAFLYAIRIYSSGETFNLCPADVCQGVDGAELARPACPADAPRNNLRVEGYLPPMQIVADVERLMRAAGIELGGVEYFIDDRDGRHYFYDINALSNFVADAPRVVGFDPFARLADWLEQEVAAAAQEVR